MKIEGNAAVFIVKFTEISGKNKDFTETVTSILNLINL